MSWTSNFKADPLAEIARWSDMRWPWALIIFLSCALVVLAHNVFQVWLYMKPCEQCVYIRFGFLVIALGGLITIINPKNLALKLVGAVVGIYGAVYGLMCSILPTGDCGYDTAVVPDGTVLSDAQRFLIDMYNSADSWYLVPAWKFMSMAQCCMLAFSVAMILIVVLAGTSGFKAWKAKQA